MASSMNKTSNLSKDQISDTNWNEDANATSSITEEQRLLCSKQSSLKMPTTNKACEKRLSKFCNRVNQMTPEQLDEELKKTQLSTSGVIDIQRTRLKHHYEYELKSGWQNPTAMSEQQFEYIAVVDFEATCDENAGSDYQHEIIEFPVVLIDVQQRAIVDKFQSYCRPTIKPILSKFCTELTGIEQHQVNNAPVFMEVLHNVETWLNERNLLSSLNKHRLAFATDGPWDFAKFLQLQCRLSSVSYPQWAEKWINIRKKFAGFYSVQRCGINKMLYKLGLSFDGRCHSGLDDAINIARITMELLKDGCVLTLNDGIPSTNLIRSTTAAGKTVLNGANDEIVFED